MGFACWLMRKVGSTARWNLDWGERWILAEGFQVVDASAAYRGQHRSLPACRAG